MLLEQVQGLRVFDVFLLIFPFNFVAAHKLHGLAILRQRWHLLDHRDRLLTHQKLRRRDVVERVLQLTGRDGDGLLRGREDGRLSQL